MRALLGLLVAIGVVHAEPAPPAKPARKSLATAMALSAAGTVAGAAALFASTKAADRGESAALMSVGALGLLVGPSIGRFYAHDPWSYGQLIRGLGLGVLAIGEGIASSCVGQGPGRPCNPPTVSAGPALAGGAIMLIGAALDIASTPDAVERYNDAHAALTPMAVRARDGGIAPGLAIAGQF